MARRELSNTALHTLEDIYAELIKCQRHLDQLIDGGDMTRTGIKAAAALAKLSLKEAMGHVVAAHPRARNVALQRRTGGAPKT